MSIIQDLYNIYDKEQAKYRSRVSSGSQLLTEMRHNLAFLRESLRERLDQSAIVAGLDNEQYRAASKNSLNLDALQKRRLERETYAGIREFDRYQGWRTSRLVDNAYERIATLKKLAVGKPPIDLRARLRTLFKFLMIVLAHIDCQPLRLSSTKKTASSR
jgi:hypothetical protein